MAKVRIFRQRCKILFRLNPLISPYCNLLILSALFPTKHLVISVFFCNFALWKRLSKHTVEWSWRSCISQPLHPALPGGEWRIYFVRVPPRQSLLNRLAGSSCPPRCRSSSTRLEYHKILTVHSIHPRALLNVCPRVSGSPPRPPYPSAQAGLPKRPRITTFTLFDFSDKMVTPRSKIRFWHGVCK